MADLSEKELQLLQILADPVAWAEATLRDPDEGNKPIKLRPYQREMLKNPSLRKVSRCGRRIGKTFTMCVHILWYAFTHEHRPQIIVTPYDSQVTMIFDMLKKFIENSPELQNSVAEMVKSPYHRIKFKNGCIIKGFTAGTKSGAGAGSVRGQAGDWVYMDEVDYMSDADFETVVTVAAANPKIGVWISSTPNGRRGMFWKTCTIKKLGWHEFYYPSMVNPDWGPQMETDFRGILTEQGYMHEVLAEFGEETVGVFRKEFIDRARKPYFYIENPDYRATRVIGVDWDKYGDASQIVVIEYDENIVNGQGIPGMFRILCRIEIPKGEFTLDNGVKKIIELNDIYHPQAIYVDRGYGEYQVETLRKYGMEHPETGIHKKVHGVAFSSSKEIIDPWTKITENKPIKPFMVNQLVILFERDRMVISEYDEMIIRQLENYRMLKKTQNGIPVFTNEDEHTIDCMMLAILGFIEKFPNIAATLIDFKPATKFFSIQTKARNVLAEIVNADEDSKEKDYLQWDEPGSPPMKKVELGSKPGDKKNPRSFGWATRGTNLFKEHKRGSW